MNKRLLFLSIIFLSTCLQISAQYTNVDFESGPTGASWNWVMDQNADDPPLEIIANPVSGGINTTTTVAKFTARTGGQPFALTYTDDIEPFQINATNAIIKIMVYKTRTSNVAIKLEGAGYPPIEINIANTVINQWQELTYNFSGAIGRTYTRLVVIPDFQTRTQDNIIYFDNIQIPAGNIAPPPSPATAAPTPPVRNASDVISIFSDAYTNVAGTDTNPNWGQATVSTQVSIEGNNTLKYANLNYQGTQFGSNQDVSGLEFLHVDFWTANSTDLGIYLISPGPVEKEYVFSITPDQWNSVDIPISFFGSLPGPLVNTSNTFQFKVEGNGDVWIDNLYFYAGAPLPVELLSFSAKAEDKSTHLYWETATETNNDYFQIEKSVDGILFSPITKVNGAGTSSSPQSYEAWDNSPSIGINYYRLKQVDMDGTFSYSNTISVRFKSDRTLSLVNRRIVDQNIQLTYEVPNEGKYSLMIVDATGRVLYRDELDLTEGLNEIAFDTPAVGVLMLVLSNRNERSVDKIFK